MHPRDIRQDLDETLAAIITFTSRLESPQAAMLEKVAGQLQGFVSRHRHDLSFDHFPLPAGEHDTLCVYELCGDAKGGPTLQINAIRGGIDSVVHNHGTWAVIVAIEGCEHNRIYRRIDDASRAGYASLVLGRETAVSPGRSLVLQEGVFHSIHTLADAPALQLHLYGQSIDTSSGRQIVDLQTGRLVYLSQP